MQSIAERTADKSLAVLEKVFTLAAREARRQKRALADGDLLTALEVYDHGEKKARAPEYDERVAVHELGHAYMEYISGNRPSYITIESRGRFVGYTMPANQEDVMLYTKEELLAKIRSTLGGRAAEQVFYGKEGALNTGAFGDLQRATDTAFRIVCAYGMEDGQLISLSRKEILQSELAGEYTAKVNGILKAEMENAVEAIEKAKEKIRRIAEALIRESRLTGKQFEELMEADG